jgi:methylamine---glutamate N-methyltransferase subunit C
MLKIPDTQQNEDRCICRDCPSFPGEGIFYCARGKSEKPVRERGCVCPDCAIFKEFRLQDGYYCADGAAGEGPK